MNEIIYQEVKFWLLFITIALIVDRWVLVVLKNYFGKDKYDPKPYIDKVVDALKKDPHKEIEELRYYD